MTSLRCDFYPISVNKNKIDNEYVIYVSLCFLLVCVLDPNLAVITGTMSTKFPLIRKFKRFVVIRIFAI